jgi:hypothetical protein
VSSSKGHEERGPSRRRSDPAEYMSENCGNSASNCWPDMEAFDISPSKMIGLALKTAAAVDK